MNPVLIGVLVYLVAQLLIGFVISRRIRSEADYWLAGRRLGLGLGTFTMFATWFGAETCVSSAGSMYTNGLAGGAAEPFGYGACLLFLGLAFAVPLWKRGFTTLADLFRERYSAGIERAVVAILVPTSVLWAAAQIRAFGQVLDALAGWGFATGTAIAAGVAMLYTVSGGMLADVVTDFLQGLVLIFGLGLMLLAVVPELGGFGEAWTSVEPARLVWIGAGQSPLVLAEAWAVPIFGSVVTQELVARTLATRSAATARNAAVLGGSLYILVGLVPAFLGLVAPKLIPGLEQPEQVLTLLAQKHLSTFAYVLFAGALISAILSTVDSALLAASALVTHNLVLPLRPDLSEVGKVRLARAGVLVAALIAFVLAIQAESIFALVESSSSFGGAGVFVVMAFGLFTRFGTRRSAWAALFVGAGVWIGAERVAGIQWPYLASLGAATLAYGLAGVMERRFGGPAGGR